LLARKDHNQRGDRRLEVVVDHGVEFLLPEPATSTISLSTTCTCTGLAPRVT
jgi:hypothetical protein